MGDKYFIFDMDETLAELFSVYYFIGTFRLKETCNDNSNLCRKIPISLLESLENGYKLFVEKVLNQEKSNTPLGILRPGILNIMNELNKLKIQHKIKNVVIYSNNGHLESLEFIRDLIHLYVGSNDLIRECIHWNHPMRNNEIMENENKTWDILKNILVKGNCKALPDLKSSDVYFFDDLAHNNLKRNLSENYYQVPGYNFKASFDRLSEIFKDILEKVNMEDMELLKNYIVSLYGDRNSNFNNEEDVIDYIIKLFKSKTKGTVESNVLPPGPDSGIEMMKYAIEKVNSIKGGKMKRHIRNGTRKLKIKKYRIKSRSRKN